MTTGNRSAIANLVKQLSKLVKVRYVEDITHALRVERELVLFKVRAPPGPARTEVLQLVDIFRARVIDVSGAASLPSACCVKPHASLVNSGPSDSELTVVELVVQRGP